MMKDLFNPSRGKTVLRHSFYRHCFIVNAPGSSPQASLQKSVIAVTKN